VRGELHRIVRALRKLGDPWDDVHASDAEENKKAAFNMSRTQPYAIPLRALIARDVDGLMMAGRCISGGFIAHSSYRVTGNAVAMGEAAGATDDVGAATASAAAGTPRESRSRPMGCRRVRG